MSFNNQLCNTAVQLLVLPAAASNINLYVITSFKIAVKDQCVIMFRSVPKCVLSLPCT